MKNAMILLVAMLFLSGCETTSPAISKSDVGNLEINITGTDQQQLPTAELYLDGVFVGNPSSRLPVIYVKRGERTIRVTCPGYKPYEKKITVLGDPNHQVLNILLLKE